MKELWKVASVVFWMVLFSIPAITVAGNIEAKLPAGSAFQVISGTQVLMEVQSDGKVGIGTTTPTQKLDVVGTVKATSFSGDGSGLSNVLTSESDPTVNALGKATLTCTTDQIAKWNGSQWACASDDTGSGVPSGFMILGDSITPPAGYTYTGETVGNNHWLYKNEMSSMRAEFAAAKVNDKVYVVGGCCDYPNEEYDLSTDTWTTKSAMPTARDGLATAVVNNRVYAIGGRDGSGPLATVEEYDPVTDTWIAKSPMPTARGYLAAAAVNGKIYAIGGYNVGYLSTVEEYDPATDTWTTKSPMPTARGYLAAAAVNNKIYVMGGYIGTALTTVEEYDPASDTWATKTPMSTARDYFAAVTVDTTIYAIGGHNGTTRVSTTEIYTPSENSWRVGPKMNSYRSSHAAAAVANRIYAIAGEDNSNGRTVEELNTRIFYIHRKD